MPRLRALTTEGGRKRGEEFDASDADARLLTAADLPGGPKAVLVDRVMKVTEANHEPLGETPRRRYQRRDMQARE